MKFLILLFVFFTTALSQAQTAIIAHKSHSGAAADFFTDPSTNFGIPSRKLLQVVYLNDSTVVKVYSRFGEDFEYDTIHTATSYSLNIDSVKQQNFYLQKVEYVNFKHSAKSSKIKQTKVEAKPDPEILYDDDQAQPQQEEPKKKKKKSYLFFLFGITGGGMLLMKLFKRPTVKPSIA
ncbi:hypothetical protein D3C87_34370 [compost metagenome]